MGRTLSGLWTAAMLALAGPVASAQERVWTEESAVARASAASPRVRTAQATLASTRALAVFGRVPWVGNPVLGVRALPGWPNQGATTYTLAVGLPFDVSSTRGHWRREANAAARAAEAELHAAANDARAEARLALIDVATADLAVAAAASFVDNARELLARTRVRLGAQAATGLDLSLSERELAEAEAGLAASQREREGAALRFRTALDLSPTADVRVVAPPAPSLPMGLSRGRAAAIAPTRRWEPRALGALMARHRISIDRYRAAAVSPLTVNLEAEMQMNPDAVWSGGLSAQWALPVLQTAQGERAVAQGEAQLAGTRRALNERAIGREAASAWVELDNRLTELRALRERGLPAAERAMAQTLALFDAGSVDYFRVLLMRRELFALRFRLIAAERDALRARVALDQILGGP